MLGQFRQPAAADLLMPLGQFARHRGIARAKDIRHVGERRGKPRRPFEKH